MKENEEDINKWKNIPCSWIKEIIFLNVHATQSHLQMQSNPYQNTNGIFHRNRINNPKICVEPQKTLRAKAILRKNKARSTMLLDFKLYYKAIEIKQYDSGIKTDT